MTHIFVIHKDKLQYIPPVVSVCLILRDLGYEVTLIDEGVSQNLKEVFQNRKITMIEIPRHSSSRKPLILMMSYFVFRRKVFKYLKSEATDQSLLWIEGGHTLTSLGSIIKKYKYVLQISELYEMAKVHFKSIGKVINGAQAVFLPEFNRSILYQVWFKLDKRPLLLPNKPYFIPTTKELESLREKYKKQLNQLEGKKVVLFMGHIRNITNYIIALKEMGSEYQMLLVGHGNRIISKWKEIDSSIIFIDFIPAPDYLVFASCAHIGILSYKPNSLNNVFCAPNKLYEYSAFGVPMIGNKIPGLIYTMEYAGAGMTVDEDNVEEIKKAIKMIDNNYSEFRKRAYEFYCAADNKKTISDAIKSI